MLYFQVFKEDLIIIKYNFATQLLEVSTPEFKAYIKQVKSNAKALAEFLINNGFKLITGGTDNHLLLVDLKNKNVEEVRLNIYVNVLIFHLIKILL